MSARRSGVPEHQPRGRRDAPPVRPSYEVTLERSTRTSEAAGSLQDRAAELDHLVGQFSV